MRFTWFAEDGCWRAEPSNAGPAGAVALGLGSVDVEFDRIDLGRFVTVVVHDDPDAARYLAEAWDALVRAAAADGAFVEVDISDTPLWNARHLLAVAAHLTEDYALLAAAAAGIAAAELAHVLHALGPLAPDHPVDALRLATRMLAAVRHDGHPEVAPTAIGRLRTLGEHFLTWAPPELQPWVRALADPAEYGAQEVPPPTPPPTTFVSAADDGARIGDAQTGRIAWSGELGTFVVADSEHSATIRMLAGGIAEITFSPADAGDAPAPWWAELWSGDLLLTAGPVNGEAPTTWFGPVDRPPDRAVVGRSPYRSTELDVVDQAARARDAGRAALRLEIVDEDAAVRRWRVSAEHWLGVDEVGRAAIAYDRAADLAEHLGLPADHRVRARAVAPAWALPYVGGRTGSPFRPLWALAHPSVEPVMRPEDNDPFGGGPFGDDPLSGAPAGADPLGADLLGADPLGADLLGAEADDRFYEEEEPVGREAARALFAATEGLLARLDRMGNQILASANRRQAQGMTFLVSGPWGTGKSSALRYLQDHVVDAAARTGRSRPVFAWFQAPLYEGRSARAGLLLETYLAVDRSVAQSVDAGPVAGATDFLLRAMGTNPDDLKDHLDIPEDQFLEVKHLHLRRLLAKAVDDSISSGMMLEQWLPRYHRAVSGSRQPTVVFVDDLDRCRSTEYVRDVLVATNYWRHLTHHHVVIAADERRIRDALGRAAGGEEPDAGLGKYVHVTLHLPDVIEKPTAAAELFGRFVARNAFRPDLVETLHRHLGDVGWADRGLLGPLLDPCTPRLLKQRFNALASALGGSAEFSDQIVQRTVLEVRWPDAFRRHVEPAELGDNRVQLARCRHLVELASVVRHDTPHADRVTQEATLADIAQRSGVAFDHAEAGLWLYLAAHRPQWLHRGQETGSSLSSALVTALRSPESVITTDTADTGVSSEAEFTGRLTVLRTAAEIRDEQGMRSAFEDVVPLMEDADELPSHLAPVVGNLALRFAAMGMPQHALRLHICAVRADRDHTNVSQNFADYVLDREVRQLYGVCDEVLGHIERSPTGHLWKPLRTRLLRMRLTIAQDRPANREEFTELVHRAVEPDARLSAGDLVDMLTAADALKCYDLVEAIGDALIESEEGNLYEQIRSLRAIGDTIANSDEPRNEDFGATIYQFLLASGLSRQLTQQHQADTMTNLATLLNQRDGARAGWYLEWAAYRLHQSPELKLRLARAYNGAGETETGRAMLEGRIAVPERPPVEPPFPQPLLPPHPQAEAFCARHFPDVPYDDPMLPELWEAT